MRRERRLDHVEQRLGRLPSPAPVDDRLAAFAGDPCGFAEALVDPDTGRPFALYDAERRFLAEALALTAGGALPYPELVFSAPKKSGKTTLAALVLLYVVRVIGGRGAEAYCVANDFDQAAGRVFKAALRILEASPLLTGTATVTADVLAFADGATITALPADYAGAAGANPAIVAFDELWAYTSERSRRLWDELVPVPTRPVSVRLTTTYAGFEGESDLLEELARRGRAGEEIAPGLYRQDGFLMFWTHEPVAPWQTPAWLAQMRRQLRPSAYLRMVENRFVAGAAGFVDPAWWAACEQPELRPVVRDPALAVWVGVDASVTRDQTAIAAVTWREDVKRVRLVWHRTWQPSPADPLDFEATIEATLRELRGRFRVREVRYDPYQLVAVAQRLAAAGLPMVAFPQTVPNLTAASTCLYDLVKGRNLEAYPDPALRLAVHRAVALETARGWRIAKERAGHKIDVVVALAQACLAAAQTPTHAPFLFGFGGAYRLDRDEAPRAEEPEPADALDEDALRRSGGVWFPGEAWPAAGEPVERGRFTGDPRPPLEPPAEGEP